MLQAFVLAGAVVLLAACVAGVSLAWSLGPRWRAAITTGSILATLAIGLVAWHGRADARMWAFEPDHPKDGGGTCTYVCVSVPFPCQGMDGKWETCWMTYCGCI